MARYSVLSSLFPLLLSIFGSVDATVVSSDSVLGSCPTIDGYTYVTVNGTFQVSCGVDYYGTNIQGTGQKTTFQACINKCAANPSCQSLSWVSDQSTCWIKPAIYAPRKSSTNWGVKLISGPGPSGNVVPPPAESIISAQPIELGPTVDPTINRDNLTLIVPATTSNLCYGSNTVGAPTINLAVTLLYPSVVLDDSSFISTACSAGTLTAAFATPDSYTQAVNTWPTGSFVLITAASTCSPDGQNVYFVATAISFAGQTATAAGSIAALSDVVEDLSLSLGSTGASTKRDLSARQVSVNSFSLPMNISPLVSVLTPSPWGNQYPLYGFNVASADPRYASESNDLAAMSANHTLTGVTNPSPGIQMFCVNCAVSGSLAADMFLLVSGGTLINGFVGLKGSVEADIAIGVNAFTEYSMLNGIYAPVLSMGLPASVITIKNIITLTPSLDMSVTAAFDHSTPGTLGQFVAGASYKGNSVSALLELANPGTSSLTGTVFAAPSTTYNVYGNVTSSMSANLQYGLSFNVNLFNGKIIKNINMSTSVGFGSNSVFTPKAAAGNSCGGVNWGMTDFASSDIYANGAKVAEFLNQNSAAPIATGCASRGSTPSSTSSSSTSRSSTSSRRSTTSSSRSVIPSSSTSTTSQVTPPSSLTTSSTSSTLLSTVLQIAPLTSSTTSSTTLYSTTMYIAPLPSSTTSSTSLSSTLSTTSSTAACTPTLISNGNFSQIRGGQYAVDWYTDGNVLQSTEQISFGETHAGGSGYQCRMVPYGTPATWSISQDVTLCPYQNYTLTAWLRYYSDGPVDLFCNVTACVGNQCGVVMTDTVNPNNPQWVQGTLNYKGTVNTDLEVQFYVGQCDLSFAIADVAVTAVAPPAPITSTSSTSRGSSTTSSSSSSITSFTSSSKTSSTSSTSSSTSSTTSAAVPGFTLAPNIVCPQANGTTYTDSHGLIYQILCDTDYLGNDMNNIMAPDFLTCISTCFSQSNHDCIGIAWVPGRNFANCNYKYDWHPLPATDVNNLVYSASLIGAPPCSTLSCPANTQQFCMSNGQIFKIACEVAYKADPIVGFNVPTLSGCIDKCSSWNGSQACMGVDYYNSAYRVPGSGTWPSLNCYLLSLATAYQSYLINGAQANAADNGGWSALTMATVQLDSDPLKRRRDLNGISMGEMVSRGVPVTSGEESANRD